MSTLKLRPTQEKALADVAAAFRAGHKRVMLSSPCGWGKSELAAAMLEQTRQNNRRGIFVADRIALCNQASERLDKYEIPHGVFQGAGHPKYAPSANIQVGSVQTLVRRRTDPFHLTVHDEAHQLYAWSKRQLEAKEGYHVGLSASAFTKGLGNYFDCIVNGPTTNEMIEQGWLVPLKIYSCREPDMSDVPIASDGEWEAKAAEKEVLTITGDIVANYLEHGNNEKFICFATTIAHAKELQSQFIAAGINACTYTADDDSDDKKDLVEEFKKNDSLIKGLISVAALVKGFDETSIKILIIARPIRRSLADHIQILGRIMRIHEGKEFGTVFDHAGNCARFWHRTQRFFEVGLEKLNKGEKEETEESAKEKNEKPEPDPIKCPSCGHLHLPAPVCANCGFEFPKRFMVETVPGTLKELIATGNKKMMTEQLWPQIVHYVSMMKNIHGEWVRKPTTDAENQRRAQAIFRTMTGDFAKARVEMTEMVACSEAVRARITAQNIRYAKGMAKKRKAA